ncbi:MAG TPA: NAD(P)H-dependent dehydrogenase/reductase [Firmicutes bacterium]|mgnify:FL=1|nr:NAD(P)H-dependent dehydrogenase/reductase [Bacillota bacterium]
MDFFEVLRQRRSIRRYKRQPVEPEKIALLTEAALRAPSSRALNPWEFILVDRGDLLAKLSQAKADGSSFLKEAPLAVVVCADPAKCDVWIEDTAIASLLILLAAEALGLGSCWIQIRERRHGSGGTAEEFVREVLTIPQNLKVEAIIALGYPAERRPGHPKEELQFEKVFTNMYGQRSG